MGAVLVAAATAATPTLTLAASSPAVAYGKTVTMTGTLSTQKANQQITIQALACGTTKTTNAARVKTAANGAYTATVTPTINTAYQATQKATKSNSVSVSVKPVVGIKRLKRGSFTATLVAGADFKGKVLLLQRYAKVRKRWVQVKKVTLTKSSAGTPKPTIISTASFKAKVAKGTRVRLVLTKAHAAPCYAAANSNVVRN